MASLSNRFTAVVFDLDGTLVDTAPGLAKVVNRTLAEGGLPALDVDTVKYAIGGSVEEMMTTVVEAAGGGFDGHSLDDWVAIYRGELDKHDVLEDPPFAGVPEVLAGLRDAWDSGWRCAPTSAWIRRPRSSRRWGFFSDLFEVIVAEDQLDGFRKPDPRHLLAVLEGLGVAADKAVMIGDHANDFNCARGAERAHRAVPLRLLAGAPRGPWGRTRSSRRSRNCRQRWKDCSWFAVLFH